MKVLNLVTNWAHDGKFILIDGHTRRHCANKAGLTSVPCIIHHFNTLEEAKKFAIREQTDRRNLSGEALLQAVANFNFEKGKGNAGDEKGKASEIIGKQLGVSSKTVENARVVLKEATEEQKEAIRKEELSVNQVYNQIWGKASAEKAEASQPKLSTKEKTEKEKWYTMLFRKFTIKIGGKQVEVNKGLTDAYIEKSTQLAEWEN